MCWSLYKQYDSKSLTYVLYDTVGQLPPDALQGEYEINPNGSAESWNKPQQLQKAIARLQMFRGSPYWRQDELEKSVMELDDPRMIKRAFTDPGTTLKEQMEVQAQEISIMLLGFPAQVEPGDDDKAHIQSMEGFVQRRVQAQEPITPEFARLMLQHGADHDNALAQKGDKQINAVRQSMQPLISFLSQVAQSDAQPPQNILQGPGATGGTGMSSPGGSPAPAGGSQDPIADATRVMQALAALKKSGVPVTHQEVDTALAAAGLPPLEAGTAIPPELKPEAVNVEPALQQQGGVP
jgi:hypothetical protein